jgi:archaellum component FlaF (FlaF/FlaG flagellin family)
MKENFSMVGVIYVLVFFNTGYFTNDNVSDGIENATHNTFSNFRKKLATEIKISSFFLEMSKHKQEII